MVIKALSYFTSLLACINIISAIPLQPRILDIGQVNQHAERRSNFAQRAPQEVSELIEALPENDVPQDIVSTQYTDYEPQEFTIAGNLDGGFREKGTGSKQPPTTNGNIPLIPTRKHHPNVEPDFRNDVEHKKGGEGADTELTPEEQEEKETLFDILYSHMDTGQKAFIQVLNTMKGHIHKDQMFDAAKKAAIGIGGSVTVAWVIQNWSLIAVGIGLAL